MATYQQSITALVDGLKTLFENRTCTEAQALANAASKPNTIYYTTDTKCVVVGGQIYGRGQQLSSVFRFCPAGSVPGQDPDFSDPDYIYIVPDGTSFTLYWLNPGGAWSHTTGFQFDIATSASDISYDLTPTPDLGTGDVQSAIEALDGKVGDVDQRIDDEKAEFIKDRFPSQNVSNYSRTNVNYKVKIVNGVVTYISNSSYITGFYSKPIHKGSLCNLNLYYSSASSGWGGLSFWGYSTQNPVDYIASHGNIVGLPTTPIKISYTAGVWIRDLWYMMPEDGYLICSYQNTYGPTFGSGCYIYDSMSFKDWYNKGLADGSAMASIVGLGYNIFDYISGAVNMDGFEYGVEYMRNSIITPLTGTLKQRYNSNKNFVYFPKVDVSVLTPDGEYAFAECSNLVLVPDMNYRTGSEGDCYRMFDNCKKLKHVGSFGNMQPTRLNYMFGGCSALLTVGKIDTSKVTAPTLCFNATGAIRRVEEFDFTAMGNVAQNDLFYNTNNSSLRYWLIKNIGTKSSSTSLNFSRVLNWGIPEAAYSQYTSDARQSLINTLITYSFDRATAGYSTCTVTLSANTKALLTDEEIEQITAKGYTIA